MKAFYVIKKDGGQVGPISELEIANLLSAGELTADCRAWCEGMTDWLPLEQIVLSQPVSSPVPVAAPYPTASAGMQALAPVIPSTPMPPRAMASYQTVGGPRATQMPQGMVPPPVVCASVAGTPKKSWNVVTAFVSCWKRSVTFSGRASRAEFWFWMLSWMIILILLLAVDESQILFSVYGCVSMLPTCSVTARRMHDIGMSGWLSLGHIIPIFSFVLFIMALGASHGPNIYGNGPANPE